MIKDLKKFEILNMDIVYLSEANLTEDAKAFNKREESIDSKICFSDDNSIFAIHAHNVNGLEDISIYFANSFGKSKSNYWINLMIYEIKNDEYTNYVISKDIRELLKKYEIEYLGTSSKESKLFFDSLIKKHKLTFKDIFEELTSETELKMILAS